MKGLGPPLLRSGTAVGCHLTPFLDRRGGPSPQLVQVPLRTLCCIGERPWQARRMRPRSWIDPTDCEPAAHGLLAFRIAHTDWQSLACPLTAGVQRHGKRFLWVCAVVRPAVSTFFNIWHAKDSHLAALGSKK